MAEYPVPGATTEPAGGVIAVCESGSCAYMAGLRPGFRILEVDGEPLRDYIDWLWLSADDEIEVRYEDEDGSVGTAVLARDYDEPWGIEFSSLVFDGVKTCRNACVFCFMTMLPGDARDSLTLRDDDYRLSFLSGTFVTLTNLADADIDRIIDQHISPLRFSLHAFGSEARRALMGKHEARGVEAFLRLQEAGIDFDVQIVLVPGMNDGAVLDETLAWAAQQPSILCIGIVPLGFTKHQDRFSESFDTPEAARTVVEQVEHANTLRDEPWVYAADEFYLNAYGEDALDHMPTMEDYGAFDMFEDGIGMVRDFAEQWSDLESSEIVREAAETLLSHDVVAKMICGEGLAPLYRRIVPSELTDHFEIFPVENRYFGGNVNVTGLLCGSDIIAAIQAAKPERQDANRVFCVPAFVFNSDGLTLDGLTLSDIREAIAFPLCVVSYSPRDFLEEIARFVDGME